MRLHCRVQVDINWYWRLPLVDRLVLPACCVKDLSYRDPIPRARDNIDMFILSILNEARNFKSEICMHQGVAPTLLKLLLKMTYSISCIGKCKLWAKFCKVDFSEMAKAVYVTHLIPCRCEWYICIHASISVDQISLRYESEVFFWIFNIKPQVNIMTFCYKCFLKICTATNALDFCIKRELTHYARRSFK